jgi:hypothetical protein
VFCPSMSVTSFLMLLLKLQLLQFIWLFCCKQRITGWKQREHPMLYNALHIGDQLLNVASVMVQSASDAQKLIRGATSLYVSK